MAELWSFKALVPMHMCHLAKYFIFGFLARTLKIWRYGHYFYVAHHLGQD